MYSGSQGSILSMFSELNCVCKELSTLSSSINMLKKHKTHLILYHVECMEQFGPSSAFNSERCVTIKYPVVVLHPTCAMSCICTCRFETFNAFIRAQNIYGNKHAPNCDIGYRFVVIGHLRHICEGGYFSRDLRYVI